MKKIVCLFFLVAIPTLSSAGTKWVTLPRAEEKPTYTQPTQPSTQPILPLNLGIYFPGPGIEMGTKLTDLRINGAVCFDSPTVALGGSVVWEIPATPGGNNYFLLGGEVLGLMENSTFREVHYGPILGLGGEIEGFTWNFSIVPSFKGGTGQVEIKYQVGIGFLLGKEFNFWSGYKPLPKLSSITITNDNNSVPPPPPPPPN